MLIKGVLEIPKALRVITKLSSSGPVSRYAISRPIQLISQLKAQTDDSQSQKWSIQYINTISENQPICECRVEAQISEIANTMIRPKRVSAVSIETELSCPLTENFCENPKTDKFLQKLSKTLAKLFLCMEMDVDDMNLTDTEFKILEEVVIKKFTNQTEKKFSSIYKLNDKPEILEKMNQLIAEHKSTKRVEENNKFIYKYTIKYLKRCYYLKNGLKNTQTSEILFYDYYFKPISDQLKIPLDNFYDPLYKTLNKNPAFKTINNRYMALIFTSVQFKADFFNFLKSDFKKMYSEMVPNKLNKFFRKLRAELNAAEPLYKSVDECKEKFARKLQKNRKCKLPWTYREISCAVAQFNSLIYYY